MTKSSQPMPMLVKVLAVVITLAVSGTGVLAVVSHHVPERSTRYGLARALEGAQADAFGMTVFLVGLLPLALLAGSPRRAAWFGGIVGVLVLASLFVGAG